MIKRQLKDSAIVLRRTNFGEADKIVTLLTAQNGKLSAMAKGVRRAKSKLAGGIELFATCEVTVMQGKGTVGTITSARLEQFYGNILTDYERMQCAYECIKVVNKVAETIDAPEVFSLLKESFIYLDARHIEVAQVEIWFWLQYLQLVGTPLNTSADANGGRLQAEAKYEFNFAEQAFVQAPRGRFGSDHIKYLRLAGNKNPAILQQVSGVDGVIGDCLWLTRQLVR